MANIETGRRLFILALPSSRSTPCERASQIGSLLVLPPSVAFRDVARRHPAPKRPNLLHMSCALHPERLPMVLSMGRQTGLKDCARSALALSGDVGWIAYSVAMSAPR